MIDLLIYRPECGGLGSSCFGGEPVESLFKSLTWPSCSTCHGAMQYLGRIEKEGKLLQLFMCQNKPGLCGDWKADGGANAVIIMPLKTLRSVRAPAQFKTTLPHHYGTQVVAFDAKDYDQARVNWAGQESASPRHVLGQLAGQPAWVQDDETPLCNQCRQPMRFIAQLETGPDWKTEMNFGGGCGYLFDCSCQESAKFLWQC